MAGIPRSEDDVAHASETYSENVRFAAEKLKTHDLLCLIEPINKYTIPGYHLNSYDQAMEVIRLDNSNNLKIQYVSGTQKLLKIEISYSSPVFKFWKKKTYVIF